MKASPPARGPVVAEEAEVEGAVVLQVAQGEDSAEEVLRGVDGFLDSLEVGEEVDLAALEEEVAAEVGGNV